MTKSSNSSPWYREPAMLLVLGLPAAAVIASLITLWIAIDNRDTLVYDAAKGGAPRHSMPAKAGQ